MKTMIIDGRFWIENGRERRCISNFTILVTKEVVRKNRDRRVVSKRFELLLTLSKGSQYRFYLTSGEFDNNRKWAEKIRNVSSLKAVYYPKDLNLIRWAAMCNSKPIYEEDLRLNKVARNFRQFVWREIREGRLYCKDQILFYGLENGVEVGFIQEDRVCIHPSHLVSVFNSLFYKASPMLQRHIGTGLVDTKIIEQATRNSKANSVIQLRVPGSKPSRRMYVWAFFRSSLPKVKTFSECLMKKNKKRPKPDVRHLVEDGTKGEVDPGRAAPSSLEKVPQVMTN